MNISYDIFVLEYCQFSNDKEKGHDLELYQSVLHEAKYLIIDRLVKWLCEGNYMDAVNIKYTLVQNRDRKGFLGIWRNTIKGPDGAILMDESDNVSHFTTSGNVETTITPMILEQNLFFCPKGCHIGKSNGERCRDCVVWAKTYNEGNVGWIKENYLKWSTVRKEVIFDHDLSVNAYSSETDNTHVWTT